MQVTWEKTLPRWAATACAVFGFANIVGAVTGPSELTFPGLVIGSAWAAVGLKGGLPLFASVPRTVASSSERVAGGLRTIRRRRVIAFLCLLAWLPIAFAVLPQLPQNFVDTFFFLTVLPVGGAFIVWSLTACPRCDRNFFPVGRPRLVASLNRCHNCGLGLHDA
jgi:hypothetical protein